MRDLASVVTIETKNKMFEKDRICVVTFKELGYEAIVPIDYNVGDKMVFIQEGAILPEEEKWEFLRKRCYKEDLKGFLIKPMTMGAKDLNGEKGDRVKSWGLCVSLSEAGLDTNLKAGTDVTDKLNIRKYEPEEDASPQKMTKIPKFIKWCLKHKLTRWIGNRYLSKRKLKYQKTTFPIDIISKSDETTIQNCKSIMSMFPGSQAFITAKMEGQSFTCSLDKKKKDSFYICSRNNRFDTVTDESRQFWATAERYDIEKKLKDYLKKTGVRLIIQGEQCGPGIQSNIYGFKETRWFVFRMKGLINGNWEECNWYGMRDICYKLGLEPVPLLEFVDDMSKYNSIESLVERAEQASWNNFTFDYHPSVEHGDKMWKTYGQHEGIVVKSTNYNKERNIGYSFKVKNLAYAEKGLPEIAKARTGWKSNEEKK